MVTGRFWVERSQRRRWAPLSSAVISLLTGEGKPFWTCLCRNAGKVPAHRSQLLGRDQQASQGQYNGLGRRGQRLAPGVLAPLLEPYPVLRSELARAVRIDRAAYHDFSFGQQQLFVGGAVEHRSQCRPQVYSFSVRSRVLLEIITTIK